MGGDKIAMRSWMKMGITLLCVSFFLAFPAGQAHAASGKSQKPMICGVPKPYGQSKSDVYYLYDAHTNYSYGYQLTVSLWKDRCPLAFGVASIHSFDVGSPPGTLSVSVYNCDTKLGGYTRSMETPPGARITTIASKNVPVGPYYFVQAYYLNDSGISTMVYQTDTCVATP